MTYERTRSLLYLSHSLSAWNSRTFEFGAFLFLAAIYPQTLLPASIYAVARAGSAALISPWLGQYIDSTERLTVIRVSIVGERAAVITSCLLLWSMTRFTVLRESQLWSSALLVLLCTFAAVEKLSAVANTIAIERDWVVVIAEGDESRLRTLNSQMRRIDLFCKLAAPLAVSSIDAFSTRAAILATAALTLLSVGIEYFAIARVYHAVPALHRSVSSETRNHSTDPEIRMWPRIMETFSGTITYARHRAFLPSFALALLYLTVLSFSGQMITYLLALGVKSEMVGVLRGLAALSEMSATWLAPRIIDHIGSIRAGIWFINFQIFCVAIACAFLWLDATSTIAVAGTIAAIIASRVGLWGFDLSAQNIVQEEVEEDLRGTFSSQEFAFQNIFEMLSFATTVVMSRPDQFRYPATISAGAVGLAGVLYATFVRARRGHLIHLSRCIERSHKVEGAHRWSRLAAEDDGDGSVHELRDETSA